MATTTTTTVCKNNFISCFDSHLHNKNTSPADTTTALTLKLTSSDHPSKNHHHHVTTTTNLQFPNCWGFTTTTDNKHHDPPPSSSWLTKPPRLTPISLALCTEHLGSESGSDIISATDDAAAAASIFHSSHQNIHSTEISSSESFVVLHQQKADDFPRREIKSPRKPTTFPPPLTTMISPNSLSMRRRRDGSRLIIEAVEAPFANSYLQAERSDGRLRLSFVSYPIAGGDGDEKERDEIKEEEEEECGGETATVAEEEEKEIEDRGMEIESQQEEHAESKMEGDVNNVEKFQQRLSRSSRRCKEGSHGSKELMDSWKPAALWVSTA